MGAIWHLIIPFDFVLDYNEKYGCRARNEMRQLVAVPAHRLFFAVLLRNLDNVESAYVVWLAESLVRLRPTCHHCHSHSFRFLSLFCWIACLLLWRFAKLIGADDLQRPKGDVSRL
jgi:hypothetical protein